jgi:hypothetical protein
MTQNKIFKVGTVFSFMDFQQETYDEIGMIVNVEQDGNAFFYDVYDTKAEKPFRVNGTNLNRELDKEYWKIEYEPE